MGQRICDCSDLALEKILAPACATEADFRNIVKLGFQKRQASPSFDGVTTIITERTEWDVLVAAADGTLVAVSPFITTPALTAGEQVTEGGNDPTTYQGIPEELRKGHGSFTGEIKGLSPDNQAALSKIGCSSQLNSITGTDLEVFFFTSDNKILSKKDFTGINCYSMFISDITKEGDSRNKNMISFFLEPNWSEDLVISQADFDPSTLINT
jgi:hypothetical protein